MTVDLRELLARVELDARLYVDDRDGWDTAWRALPFQLMTYAATAMDYQMAYLRHPAQPLQDLSLVLLANGKPCGVFPLLLTGEPGARRLSGNGSRITPPLFVAGLPDKTAKKISARLMALLRELAVAHGCQTLQFEQPCMPGADAAGLPDWHRQWLEAGATGGCKHDLFTDLTPPLADIRSGFRKSYKALINTGLRSWTVQRMDAANASDAVWEEFKQLHIQVAGRRTRGDDSWDLQLRIIREGWGFAVLLRDPADGRLVGAGLFQHTRHEGVYCVGAYDRTLFDKPLGHVVQQVAIERLKELGVPWYRVGERSYPQDRPAPSPKQMAISDFKQGFASHLFPRLELDLAVRDWTAGDGSAS